MHVEEKSKLKQYFHNELGWGQHYQGDMVFDLLCEAADFAQNGVVLDAGAGGQRYKPFFSDSHYLAQEHPLSGQLNKGLTEFDILCDVKQIPLKDYSIDLILSTSSLEHMEHPEAFFHEANRVLKPGGALFVQVPFIYDEHEIPYDFQRPTRYGLERYYRQAGFDQVSVAPLSSSTYAGNYIFMQGVLEDSKRLGTSLSSKLKQRFVKYVCKTAGNLALRILDKRPNQDAKAPVGWIAKGYKPGQYVKSKFHKTKSDFIKENAICGTELIESGGKIIPKSP